MKLLTSSFYENLKMALDTIRGNKLRSFLTIVGVVVGVITVMLISSIISGINVAVEKAPGEVVIEGRWFSAGEDEAKANVCVIGDFVKESYFPYEDPVGQTIEVGGQEFRIIGLLQKREQLFGGGGGNNDQTNVIYMPIGTALKVKPQADDLFILAVAKEGQLEKAKDDVQDLLRIRRQVKVGEKNN